MTSKVYRPCLACAKLTQSIEQLCPAHRVTKTRACIDCKAAITGARANKKYCPPCKHRRKLVNEKRYRDEGTRNPQPMPNHPCPDCGCNVPGRSVRCKPCQARYHLEYVKARRRASRETLREPPPPPPRAYPCSRCRWAKASTIAASGWECSIYTAQRCQPWAQATMMEAR